MRIAIIGCGKIADSHASQIARIDNATIVAAVDQEILMANQFAERFNIPEVFSDIEKMLNVVCPDVVHITTSAQVHYKLAKICLENSTNVYVEKPFTLYHQEARHLIEIAQERNLLITVGHDDQYTNASRRLRKLIKEGKIGSDPYLMDSIYCYDLTEPGYAKAFLGDKDHWVRKLPGGLLQNIISHGIARIAEWITVDEPRVIAEGFVSPMLRDMGVEDIIDEVRVIIVDPNGVSSYFTFSSQIRPSMHGFRVFGSEGGLMLDEDQQTVLRLPGNRLKSYAEKFVSPSKIGLQYFGNSSTNLALFCKNKFHMKEGMRYLIESFYNSIQTNTETEITYQEILRTSYIMEEIFRQIGND